MCPEVWVAIPSNVLEDGKGLRAKTEKVGYIARAAAIFGVSRIHIYDIKGTLNEAPLIELLLSYLALPQYLRRKVYPIKEELRFAGQLPPLKIPSHQVPNSLALVKQGEIREGVIVLRDGHVLADVGLERPIPLSISEIPPSSSRVSVLITSGPPRVSSKAISQNEIEYYWGYEVIKFSNIKSMISKTRPTKVLIASRTGIPLRKIWREVGKMISSDERCLVVFGSPRIGVPQVLLREKINPIDIEAHSVNLFPDQKVETVRSEEAILAGLGILNFLRSIDD